MRPLGLSLMNQSSFWMLVEMSILVTLEVVSINVIAFSEGETGNAREVNGRGFIGVRLPKLLEVDGGNDTVWCDQSVKMKRLVCLGRHC
jgi:hypothetical protein